MLQDTKPLPTTRDRHLGTLIGLAVGDALGTAVEFKPRGSFAPLTDIVGGGTFQLAPGQWTDDTSMAICLVESLIECRGFDPVDQLRRYVRWWKEGYHSSKSFCFDIGTTTANSLAEFMQTGEPYRAMGDRNGGNGSLMRLAPIPLAFGEPAEAVRYAGLMSMTTHASAEAVAACQVYAVMIGRAIAGLDKAAVLDAAAILAVPGLEACPATVAAIVRGAYREKPEAAIVSDGFSVNSLEAALWCFWRTESFRDGALMAANLGYDADTTAAIYGQLAGAFYGLSGIPEGWRAKLYQVEELLALGERLASGINANS